jgi:prepilin-type processing-associated H-X9-DG protein
VVIAIIGILIALLLPAVQAAREAARRMQCANNLKQWALACHNHHDALNAFPALGDSPGVSSAASGDMGDRIGWTVMLLPYTEQSPLYQMIETGGTVCALNGTTNYGSFGGQPWDTNYIPWQTQISNLICPSDNKARTRCDGIGRRNYLASVGDFGTYWGCGETNPNPPYGPDGPKNFRGCFSRKNKRDFAFISDGTTNTFLLGEVLCGSNNSYSSSVNNARSRGDLAGINGNWTATMTWCLNAVNGWKNGTYGSVGYMGMTWADGCSGIAAFNSLLPPNSPSCMVGPLADTPHNNVIVTLSSYHSGGANVAMADGSTHFLNDTINSGDVSRNLWYMVDHHGDQSVFGVLGKLGSAAAGESVSLP